MGTDELVDWSATFSRHVLFPETDLIAGRHFFGPDPPSPQTDARRMAPTNAIDATVQAYQALKAARCAAPASMDLDELERLILQARAVCVAMGEIEDAEETLAEVKARRKSASAELAAAEAATDAEPVSYTHLTLPTILLV